VFKFQHCVSRLQLTRCLNFQVNLSTICVTKNILQNGPSDVQIIIINITVITDLLWFTLSNQIILQQIIRWLVKHNRHTRIHMSSICSCCLSCTRHDEWM